MSDYRYTLYDDEGRAFATLTVDDVRQNDTPICAVLDMAWSLRAGVVCEQILTGTASWYNWYDRDGNKWRDRT